MLGTPEMSTSTWSPGAAASSANTTTEIPRRMGTSWRSRLARKRWITASTPPLLRPRPLARVPRDLALAQPRGLPVQEPALRGGHVDAEVEGEHRQLLGQDPRRRDRHEARAPKLEAHGA